MVVARGKKKHPQVRDQVREQNRAAYRDAILAAAERVFSERGFIGVRMSDVAAEAGLATGTLYNYFENKEEVLRSLIVMRGSTLIQELQETFESERDAIARIERMVTMAFAYIERHRTGYKMLVDSGPPEVMARFCGGEVLEIQARYMSLFESAMAAAVRARRLRNKFPPKDLALFMAGAMDAMARAWIASDDSTGLADKVGLVIELFLSGASTKP
jgi:AcrR family transcriptional regulator